MPGISTSRVEVVQLTPVGLWLAWRDIELYLDHDRFPWFRCCVLLDQRHYLREARAGKGSCQPAVECGQPSAACGRQRRKVKVGDLSTTLQAILDGPIQGCAQRDVIRPERMPPESQNRCRRATTSVGVAETVR